MADLDSQLQEQERIINISYALASEASQRSKQVAGEAAGAASEAGPQPLLPGFRAQPSLSRVGGKAGIRLRNCGTVVFALALAGRGGGRVGRLSRGAGAQERWRTEVWERPCGSRLALGVVLLFCSL